MIGIEYHAELLAWQPGVGCSKILKATNQQWQNVGEEMSAAMSVMRVFLDGCLCLIFYRSFAIGVGRTAKILQVSHSIVARLQRRKSNGRS